MTFEGFPRETFTFLMGLSAHNDKAWFEAHRPDYEAAYVAPALAFVEAIGPRLRKISKGVAYEAKINGSLFRIHRDVRFSRDKTPYKDHIDLWFWEGDRRGWDTPGFFFRMSAKELMLGAGMHVFQKPALEAFRAAVLDDKRGKALEALIAKVEKAGYEIGGATRKTVPRGLPADHPRAARLLHEGLHAGWRGPIPREAWTRKLVDFCLERFEAVAPVSRWLRENVRAR